MSRVALVTGGGRGIGRAIALAFAREGLTLAVAARSREHLEEAAGSARALGVRAEAFEVDVSDVAALAPLVEGVAAALGPVDVLVNNAGIAESSPFARTDQTLWERHLRVNATAPFFLARAVLPGMLGRGWGRVINVASIAGLVGAAYISAYTASKHALVGLTRALAAEVTGRGVTVNAICPAYVATDMAWNSARNIAARTGRSFDDAVGYLAGTNPGRRLIHPDEVAAVAVRLLHDDATNGQALVLDGTEPEPAAAS